MRSIDAGPAGHTDVLRRAGRLAALAGTFAICAALPALAHAGGDAAAGKAKSQTCQACHTAVAATGDTPQLVGQRETYMVKQLKAFKSGDRKNKLMSAIATQLSDADIANIAAYWASQPAGSDTAVPADVAAIRKAQMSFPKDFPKGFVLYHTSNSEETGVVNLTYVNAVGLRAAKAAKPLPDGTVIIVAKHVPKVDANNQRIVEADGTWKPDALKSYTGMEARAGWGNPIPELLRNDNWSYGVFAADKTANATINQAPCLACHKPLTSTSYVFTLKQMHAKAGAK
jgi:cytochrome c553